MKGKIPSKLWHIMKSVVKAIASAKLWEDLNNKLSGLIPEKYRGLIPAKLLKWLLLVLMLVLIIIGLSCCPREEEPAEDPQLYIVSVNNLNVHKNYNADSAVLGQLPADLEVEVLEEKTANGSDWGRIDKTKLPDGSKIKSGWIDLQYVRDPDEEEEIEETEPIVTDPIEVIPVFPSHPDPEQGITVMGTVTTGKLNVRKGTGSNYEACGSYVKGDRIEVLEIVKVDDTEWGRTGKGWIGMGYVKLDGVAPETEPASNGKPLNSDGSYQILGYGVVDLGELNVRLGPGTEYDKVAEVTKCNRYAYYQVSGNWVRIEPGWVSTDYFYLEGTTADDAIYGIVNEDNLNIRTGPSTAFMSKGTLKKGEAVEVLAQVSDWGYTANGWISMTHVDQAEPTYTTGSGTVTSGLNIRKEPNADAEIVGTYSTNDSVTVTEVQGSWGKTDKGWIRLKYVKYN